MKMDARKIQAIVEWSAPKIVSELRFFLACKLLQMIHLGL